MFAASRGRRVKTIAVIGGGIAGLTAAFELAAQHDVTLYEREASTGGKIRSHRRDGFLFEAGPGGFLSDAETLRDLVAAVGLEDALVEAAPAAKNRYIFWGGALHKLPSKPPEVLSMALLSPGGKVRAIRELFLKSPARADDALDESVDAFMQRRFGREVAARIASPALLGVSGGDVAQTSVAAVFPRVVALEREHGSVIRGMMRAARKRPRMCSFADGGMQRLTDRVTERLGDRVRTGTAVRRIEREGAGWRVVGDMGERYADGVIVATPAGAAGDIVAGMDARLAAHLRAIPYAPMRAIGIGFRAADVPALDGFGVLVARGEGVRLLGAVYASTIVPAHAPPGTVYLRVFVGGAVDPSAVALDREAARAIVLADLTTILGITAEPIAYDEHVWAQAIPQYMLTHRATVRAIEAIAAAYPALAFAGNAYRGLGVGECANDARAVARSMAAAVGTSA